MAAAKDIIPGLELLTRLATVKINQKGSRFKGNKYLVLSEGEVLFILQEQGNNLTFMTRGTIRGFNMDGVDNTGRKVFMIRRPSVLMSDKVELYMDNVLVSVVRKESTFMKHLFSINDANDCPTLRIKGHARDHFLLQTAAKVDIGSINKEFRGLLKEMFSYNDDYVINFPVDLDVRFKLAVIAGCILIDYAHHEK